MSKKLILCVVLALSLILVGTGYAYWTDTLNVTTKATTGDFDVTFVDLGAYAQYNNEYDPGNWSIIDGIVRDATNWYVGADFFERGTNTYNDVFGNPDSRAEYYDEAKDFNSVDMDAELLNPGDELDENIAENFPYGKGTVAGDTISIELNNLYPGYAQAFRSDIINIGSIAAKLSTVDFKLSKLDEFDVTKATKDLIGVALLVQDENPEKYEEIVKLAENFDAADIFPLGGVDFVRLSALETKNVEIANNFILVPGEGGEHRADLFIGIAVDPDAEGEYTTGSTEVMSNKDDTKTQNKGIKLDITFGWDQFNEGNNPENITNILELQNKN